MLDTRGTAYRAYENEECCVVHFNFNLYGTKQNDKIVFGAYECNNMALLVTVPSAQS